MPWIESHQEIKDHPKTLKLAGELTVSLNEVIGILHRFWWWCVDYAEDGDLSKYNDAQLAFAAGVSTDSSKEFIVAMIDCGFIDRDPFQVHDWYEYAGRYLESKYRTSNPKKLKQIQRRCRLSKDRLKSDFRQTTKPNLTKPNITKELEARPASVEAAIEYFGSIGVAEAEARKFFDYFSSNGWKISGKAAMKDWKAAARNWKRNLPNFAPRNQKPDAPRPVKRDPKKEQERFERISEEMRRREDEFEESRQEAQRKLMGGK